MCWNILCSACVTGSRASCPCPLQAWFTRVPCPWRECPHPRCPRSTRACPVAPSPMPTTIRTPTCPAWRATSLESRRRSSGLTTATATCTTTSTTRTRRLITPAITTTISPNRPAAREAIAAGQTPAIPIPTNQEENFLFCQSPWVSQHLPPSAPSWPMWTLFNRARPPPTGVLIPASDQSTEAQDLSLTLTVTQTGVWEDETTKPAPKACWGTFKYYCKSLSGKRHWVRRNEKSNLLDPFVEKETF